MRWSGEVSKKLWRVEPRTWVRLAMAEWFVVRARTLRTRVLILPGAIVGLSVLLALEGGSTLQAHGIVAVWVVVLGAVSVGYVAGADEDRLSLQLILTQPTRPLCVAFGRWSGALILAACAYLSGAIALWAGVGAFRGEWASVLLGLVPLAAITAVTLAATWAGGAAGAAVFVVWSLFLGSMPAELLAAIVGGGSVGTAVAQGVHAVPTLIQIRAVMKGDVLALVESVFWIGTGLAAASFTLHRRWAWPRAQG